MVTEFQYSEYAQYSKNSDHRKIAAAEEQQTHIRGKYRQQINDSEKADCIPNRFSDTYQTKNVFNREKNSEKPFNCVQKFTVCCSDGANTVEHDCNDAEQNAYYQYYVKPFPRRRVGFENYFKQDMTPSAIGFILDNCIHNLTFYKTL